MNIHNKCTGYSSSGELLFDSFYFPVSWLWKIFLSFTVFQQDLFLPFIVNSFSLQLLVHQFLGAKNVPKKPLVMPWMNQYLPLHWTQFAHMKYLLDFQCVPARSVLSFY